jgi:hypothetical protein
LRLCLSFHRAAEETPYVENEPSLPRSRSTGSSSTRSSSTRSSSTQSSSVETKGNRMTNRQKEPDRRGSSSSYVVIPSGCSTPFLISGRPPVFSPLAPHFSRGIAAAHDLFHHILYQRKTVRSCGCSLGSTLALESMGYRRGPTSWS